MSVACGVEWVVMFGCVRWAWKRCTYIGSYDSATWAPATPEEFEPVPRVCRVILAVYEDDLRRPKYAPPGGYKMNPDWVVKRVTYQQTQGRAPPYLIYVDHDNREIVLAIRGLNLVKESDYKLLMSNRLGMQMFDGGYAHHGLLKAATWLLSEESETLRQLWVENGSQYKMIFAGHSLGSGIAALMTVLVVNRLDQLGGIPRSSVRCYAVAPARCMSLNLAVKYADVIHSVILQDDFLPRTATPLELIFGSILWDNELQVLLYDLVSRWRNLGSSVEFCFACSETVCCLIHRCGRFPPEVRTAIPVEGRFEHIVLSCNATSDHGVVWIERESEKALNNMRAMKFPTTTPPAVQKMERIESLQQEHKDALERAVSLNIPHAVTALEEEEPSTSKEQNVECQDSESNEIEGTVKSQPGGGTTNWNLVVEKLLTKHESGELPMKKDTVASK